MRFIDEKQMWYSEVESLAADLANKSEREVFDLLNERDVIQLATCERIKTPAMGRLLLILLMPALLILSATKWILTGDKYLDSWIKKLHCTKLLNYCGLGSTK